MKIAIIFSSKYGATEQAAEYLANKLESDTSLFNLGKTTPPDLNSFDAIILGGSIYIGAVRKEIVKYGEENKNILTKKPLSIFVVCGAPEKNGLEYLESSFSEDVKNHAILKGCFGGKFQFDKMNFIERFMIKQMQKNDEKKQGKQKEIDLQYDTIDEFAREFLEKCTQPKG